MKTEKVNFKNSKGLNLIGILHSPKEKTDAIIVMAHGFTSNKDRKRSIRVAEIYAENKIAALRFDFGGSGKSYNTEISIEKQIDDLRSAINFVKEKGYEKIGIQGESLGGLVSLLVYDQDIKVMVLWAPVTKGKDTLKEVLIQERLSMDEFREKGFVIKKKGGREFKISKKYFEERVAINQKELLGRVKCPVLILHGDDDDCVPLEDSKEAVKILKDSELKIIKGGDHKLDMIKEVFEYSVNWFKKYLK